MVNLHFSFWFLLLFLSYLFISIIIFIIWFILRLPFSILFTINNFCIFFFSLIFLNYFQSCVLNTCNIFILLALQYLLKLTRKVIVLKIFIISLVSFHKVMASIIHVLSHRFSRTKIMSIFVLAGDTHKTNFNFLLEILNQSLFIIAVGLFRDKKTMWRLHMSQIFREIRRFDFTENTNIWIFFERLNFRFVLFLFFTSDQVWVMLFCLDMLIECISWAKLFTLLTKMYPHSLHLNSSLFSGSASALLALNWSRLTGESFTIFLFKLYLWKSDL